MYFIEERIKRILNELEQYRYPVSHPVRPFKMSEGTIEVTGGLNPDTSNWHTFSEGERWGGIDTHYTFAADIAIPGEFDGKTAVFEVKTGREGEWDALNPQFVIYVNGKLVQGLDVNHREITLSDKASAGEIYTVVLHAYTGMKGGLIDLDAQIKILDKQIEKLYYNIKVPLEVAELLDKEDKRRLDILNMLNTAINMLDLRKSFSQSFYESVKQADNYMEEEFYGKYCGHEDEIALCIGHTHIDVAWLWRVAQTREKVARSFSTVLNLMKDYPEYVFMSSQPQLYQFLKEDYPELFEEIKKRVKEGKWEPEGAMWLEPDCNLASGEALVRQILFGKKFFKDEFGTDSEILWLPDVFGYSAALPQILKKSGVNYFVTTKIGWNEYNKLPYDTFNWRGIDGTEILAHFITTRDLRNNLFPHKTTYNGVLRASDVMGAWVRYQQKDINNEVVVSYGYGDGGGGPTKEMLEEAKRLEKGIPGSPRVKMGKVLDFFKRLENNVSANRHLPKWVGELYLEYHRGTYTSMARNKKNNRTSELLFQSAEMLSIMNHCVDSKNHYPKMELNNAWRTILLNQFHDILPGSSIKEVYEDSDKDYEKIIKQGKTIVEKAICSIAEKINLDSISAVVFNQLGFDRTDVVECEIPMGFEAVEICDCNGKILPSQIVSTKDADGKTVVKLVFVAENVPAKGYKAFRIKKAAGNAAENEELLQTNTQEINCRFFDINMDSNANITSIYDKVNTREVLSPNSKANVIQAFEDKPFNWDAWDINIYYQEKMWEVNDVIDVQYIENGPVRKCLKVTKKFMDSELVQYIYVYNHIPRIDFKNRIDWKEKQILLKAAFPVDIHSDKATYEIQYGNVERPTHWNTSWDYARFEVCAHKWADLSEDGYGVSLLNDCKYGYDIKDGVMRLTLLKSATYPNPDADKEVHEFTYSLYPHKGDWKDAGTVQEAYGINCPMYVTLSEPHQGNLEAELSMVKLDKENVIIEVVKIAEDSDDIIIRLYECYNRRTKAELTFFRDINGVYECDLMENNIGEIKFNNNSFCFDIKPYEIKTFKLRVD